MGMVESLQHALAGGDGKCCQTWKYNWDGKIKFTLEQFVVLLDFIQGSPWVWLISVSRPWPTPGLMGNACMGMEISPETKICELITRPSSNEGLNSTGTNGRQVAQCIYAEFIQLKILNIYYYHTCLWEWTKIFVQGAQVCLKVTLPKDLR